MSGPFEVEQTSVESAEASGSSTSADSSSLSSTDRTIDEVASTRLDRYVLVDLVGRGSYGTVWAAYDPQLDRRVAIKLMYLRRRKDGPDAELEQMLGEAQMLAQVSHPHVVVIHDVRVLDESLGPRPRGLFIVMEFLPGPTLGEWQSTPRDWREVLAIYAEAGRGLAAAHQRGLVHRDFKPANVMFGSDERIRVLDFGLARPTSNASTVRSRGKPNRVVGTPAYMAPEQHLGQPTDARTDQYSFCVALFEALYGHRPFVGDDHHAIAASKLDGQVHPPPRNTKVPARILAVLRRGLALEPRDRYGDMQELLDALLDDPQARRRRFASLALLVAVMGGAGYGLAQAQARATESCQAPDDSFDDVWDDSLAQRVDARFAAIESDYADETRTLVATGLDDWASRWRTAHEQACERAHERGQQFTAQDPARLCLDRARRRLGGLTATLVEADAGVLARAPDAIVGLPRPESCVERGAIVPAGSNELDPARRDLILQIEGEVEQARTLSVLGRYEEALAAAIAAREHAEAQADHGGATAAAQLEASTLRALDRLDDALRANERAASLAVQANDPESVARALLQQIDLRAEVGALEAASALAGFARAYITDGRLGPELEIERDVMLGELAHSLREYAESQLLLERALARATDLYGPEHPNLARIHNLLGNLWAERDGATDEAGVHFQRALELNQRFYGEHHHSVASSLNNLATFHAESGALTTARSEFEAALAINEDIFGQHSSHLIVPMLNIAAIDGILGRHEDGLRLEERAASLAQASLPANHPLLANIYYERGRFHQSLGHLEHAADDLRRALVVQEQVFGSTHPETATIMAELAEQLRALGQLEEAERLEQLARAQLERELPTDAVGRSTALAQLARIEFDNGRFEQALEHTQQHVVHLREVFGPGAQDVAAAQIMAMRALLALDRPAEALRVGEQALADLDVEVAIAGLWPLHQLIGRAELALGHEERAIAALEQALSAVRREQGLIAEQEALTLELARLRVD